jgi:methylphosphotriester-DNA--protein-cysteine methyltransferase
VLCHVQAGDTFTVILCVVSCEGRWHKYNNIVLCHVQAGGTNTVILCVVSCAGRWHKYSNIVCCATCRQVAQIQ